MIPVPLELPLRAGETAVLAGLLFDSVRPGPIREEYRGRFAARLASTRFESFIPYAGSLAADPIHPSVYYIAVDGLLNEPRPLLLRIAEASAPASGLFPNSLLIGRMRAGLSREVVVNAIAFGPADRQSVLRFASDVDPAFRPRPPASRPPVSVAAHEPLRVLPEAFEAFRYLLRNRGVNVASIAAQELDHHHIQLTEIAAIWSAIRSGWREGYSLEIEPDVDALPAAGGYSTFICGPDLEPEIERVKSGRSGWKRFDPDPGVSARSRELTVQLDRAHPGSYADLILEAGL